MRHSLILVAVLIAAPAWAQSAGQGASGQANTAVQHPFGLDPYNPSDAKFLRDWGGVLVQQTPLLDLAALDPFKPSDAALLRRIGEGLPAPITGFVVQAANERAVVVREAAAAPAAAASAAPATIQRESTSVVTLLRPENNDGVWIQFAGDKWVSAGKAVTVDSSFMRAGTYAGFPVYRRAGDAMIYVPTRDGMAAPYRRK